MKKILAVLVGVIITTGVLAGSEPIQLSLTPDIALYNRSARIEGLTLNIWGENPQSALALGIVNGSTGRSAGLSVGLINYADSYKGVQLALFNYTKGDFRGWQFGLVSYTEGSMKGLQTGLAMNYAGRLTGLQFGLVNYAEAADAGVQIGLVNIIHQNTSWFTGLPDELAPGMILVNWRF